MSKESSDVDGDVLDVETKDAVLAQRDFTTSVLTRLDEFDVSGVVSLAVAQMDMVRDWLKVGQRMSVNVLLGVYTMKVLWDRLGLDGVWDMYRQRPWCDSDEYNGSFEQFVWKAFGVKPVTARNWIRVVDTWFVDRPDVGTVTLSNGESVEFDPAEVSPSKLLLCTAKHKAGELEPEDYAALADPSVTWADMRRRLADKGEPMTSKVVILEGGILWAKWGEAEKVPIGSLDVDSEDGVVQWGVEQIINRAKVIVRG